MDNFPSSGWFKCISCMRVGGGRLSHHCEGTGGSKALIQATYVQLWKTFKKRKSFKLEVQSPLSILHLLPLRCQYCPCWMSPAPDQPGDAIAQITSPRLPKPLWCYSVLPWRSHALPRATWKLTPQPVLPDSCLPSLLSALCDWEQQQQRSSSSHLTAAAETGEVLGLILWEVSELPWHSLASMMSSIGCDGSFITRLEVLSTAAKLCRAVLY